MRKNYAKELDILWHIADAGICPQLPLRRSKNKKRKRKKEKDKIRETAAGP